MSKFNVSTTYPIIPNAQEYMYETKYVSINSLDINTNKYPNIANFEIPKPFSVSYETSKTNLDETFTIPSINQQKKVEPFDTTTGIISNSPEIIAFSSFLPVYDSQNQLNEFGQYLQTKQDSILIRSSKIIQD